MATKINALFPRWVWLFVFSSIGFAIAMSGLLSPLHEIWHVRASESVGIPAQVTGPRSSQADEWSMEVMWAGYFYELVFATCFGLGFAFIGRHVKSGWMTGAGCLGYAVATFKEGFTSWDFNGSAKAYIQSHFPQKGAWESFHAWTIEQWTIRGIVCIALMVIVIGLCFYFPAKAKGRPGAKARAFSPYA